MGQMSSAGFLISVVFSILVRISPPFLCLRGLQSVFLEFGGGCIYVLED
jgi:hypothetical protein